MNFRITLTCRRCRCKMEFSREYAGQGKLACPNCGQEMTENDSYALRNAISALAELPEVTADGSFVQPDVGFLFTVQCNQSPVCSEEL